MLHEIAEATRGFLDLLDDGQRAVAVRSMSDDDLRKRWAYTPGERPGVVYGDLARDQRKAVHRLLSCVLSPRAYAQTAAVMALEDVLDDREGGSRDRHQGDYWTVLLGEPGDQPWGWRVEGHHLSVSVVVADGRVSATPFFLGANPARTTYQGQTVLQPLRLEEELARELLDRMGRTARGLAVVADTPPPDLKTGNSPRVGDLEPVGVTPAQLDRASRGLLVGLVRYYLDRLHSDLADEEFDALDPERLHFAWEGSAKRGEGHYYRIQGPELLIEYDNTDNDANHAHSVWRRRSGDFGDDLLAAHRASVRHE
ncbi:hypothetical protein ALI22I_22185 [Saccharothrix sp. ALI-22-I]|uniref:DUF3500 domain-containing protein n=1 Tax=Saccharothrix sp. ALI-22-I TaxID=1933778 RepID=UPI00097C7DC4|nr:DUF3500 domain-containing protein [Saccharothrix sp. ALI-22-I]ONI87169.1 hypothetical protein ALI22I_22185 [Saccharothrix sp. ALI-22-I]